MGTKIAAKWTS